MKSKGTPQTVAFTSPSSATTEIVATRFRGSMLRSADALVIDAALTGGTGGTLNVYLQRKIDVDTWRDWVAFPQITAGTTKNYTATITGIGASIVEVGTGDDATATPALTAGTAVDVVPGGDVRVVCSANVGTSAGGASSVTITPYRKSH